MRAGLLVLWLAALACRGAEPARRASASPDRPPPRDPDITGIVTASRGLAIELRAAPPPSGGELRAALSLAGVPVFIADGHGGWRRLRWVGADSVLGVGSRVAVWLSGPVLGANPIKGRAAAVMILTPASLDSVAPARSRPAV